MAHRILLVDDNATNIDVLKSILKDDYGITAAVNGPMALKIAEKTMPSLILLDVMMPGMDGFEVCKRLKENSATKDIPVIFVTAKDEGDSEQAGLALGAVGYLTKPVNADEVKACVVDILG